MAIYAISCRGVRNACMRMLTCVHVCVCVLVSEHMSELEYMLFSAGRTLVGRRLAARAVAVAEEEEERETGSSFSISLIRKNATLSHP